MSDKATTLTATPGSSGSPATPDAAPTLAQELHGALNSQEKALLKSLKGPEATAKPGDAETRSGADAGKPDKTQTDTTEDEGASVDKGEEDGDETASSKQKEQEQEQEEESDAAENTHGLAPEVFSKLDPAVRKVIEGQGKAIGRLTAKRKSAEEERDTFKEELETLRGEADASRAVQRREPTPDDPLSDLATPKEVEDYVAKAQSTLAWCRQHRNGITLPKGKDGEETTEYTKEDIAEIKERAEAIVKEHGPARLKFLGERKADSAAAVKAYPDLMKGEDGKRYAELLKAIPGLQDYAARDTFIGDALEGAKVRTGKKKSFLVGEKKPTETKPADPGTPGKKAPLSTDAASSKSASPDQLTALKNRAMTSGNPEDMARYLAAKDGE